MKKVVLLLVLLLGFLGVAESSPFLVCDPYPVTIQQPTSFLLTFDGGAPIEVPAVINTDGSVQIKYDMSSISTGGHTVIAQAKNVWGVSAASSPFVFTKPAGTLGIVGNIKIVP
jgi:hypothetical protein